MTWFIATEAVIHYRCAIGANQHIPAQRLEAIIGTHYVAAYRAKGIILDDIRRGGPGILSAAVCDQPLTVPEYIAKNSEAHLTWLMSK